MCRQTRRNIDVEYNTDSHSSIFLTPSCQTICCSFCRFLLWNINTTIFALQPIMFIYRINIPRQNQGDRIYIIFKISHFLKPFNFLISFLKDFIFSFISPISPFIPFISTLFCSTNLSMKTIRASSKHLSSATNMNIPSNT